MLNTEACRHSPTTQKQSPTHSMVSCQPEPTDALDRDKYCIRQEFIEYALEIRSEEFKIICKALDELYEGSIIRLHFQISQASQWSDWYWDYGQYLDWVGDAAMN